MRSLGRHLFLPSVFLLLALAAAGAGAAPGVTYPPTTVYAQPAATFVFLPGGTANPSAGVYTTWATLYAAAHAVRNPTVIVDSTSGSPTVPAGSWTLSNWTFTTNTYATLVFADNALCTVAYNLWIEGGLNFQTAATTAPTFTVAASAFANVFVEHDSIVSNTPAATQPFFRQATGGFLTFWVSDTSFLGYYGNGAGTMVDVPSGGNAYVWLDQSSSLLPSTLSGAGLIKVLWAPSLQASSISSTQSATNIVWLSGPATTASFSAAASLTASAAAQNIPPSGTATVLASADNLGVMVGGTGVVSRLYVSFTGSASNIGGQTAAVSCFLGGVAMTGFTVSGLATTAGVHAGNINVAAAPIFYPAGSIFTCRLTTGSLTGALSDITVALGGNGT